jgi:hypothetical protein
MCCMLLSIVVVTAFLGHPHAVAAQTLARPAAGKPAVVVTVDSNTASANGLEGRPSIGGDNRCAHHRASPEERMVQKGRRNSPKLMFMSVFLEKSSRNLSMLHQWWACPVERW